MTGILVVMLIDSELRLVSMVALQNSCLPNFTGDEFFTRWKLMSWYYTMKKPFHIATTDS
jgi:hypothetical protein